MAWLVVSVIVVAYLLKEVWARTLFMEMGFQEGEKERKIDSLRE